MADDWAANLEKWTVTTTGHLGSSEDRAGYYMRIDESADPNDGATLDVRNGGGVWDKRDVVDAGFLELVRLGIRAAGDPNIARSVRVIDSTIRIETPNGPAFRRYNHDGYGETFFGGPWLGEGIGRLWPIFTGERGEYEIALGHDPTEYLASMQRFANAGGMIPEQVWDRADPTASHFSFGSGPAARRRWRGAWRNFFAWRFVRRRSASWKCPALSPSTSWNRVSELLLRAVHSICIG